MKYVSQNVLLIFIIKDAALMHEIRNSKDLKKIFFWLLNGDAIAYWHPLNTPQMKCDDRKKLRV